jgi:hypothetical protein
MSYNNPVFHPMIIHMILSTIHEMNIKLEKLSLLDELNNKMYSLAFPITSEIVWFSGEHCSAMLDL